MVSFGTATGYVHTAWISHFPLVFLTKITWHFPPTIWEFHLQKQVSWRQHDNNNPIKKFSLYHYVFVESDEVNKDRYSTGRQKVQLDQVRYVDVY